MVIYDVLDVKVYRMYHKKCRIQEGYRTSQSQVGMDFGGGGTLTYVITDCNIAIDEGRNYCNHQKRLYHNQQVEEISQSARLRRDLQYDNRWRTLRYEILAKEEFYRNWQGVVTGLGYGNRRGTLQYVILQLKILKMETGGYVS